MKHIIYFIAIATTLLLSACGTEKVQNAVDTFVRPDIYPDYIGVTIPLNIAPLNFSMTDNEAEVIDVVFTGQLKGELHTQGKGVTNIDPKDWTKLLKDNVGSQLYVQVCAKYREGWKSFQPFGINVSEDAIDYGITYRLIEPGYESYTKMGIYETNLATAEQKAILENTQFRGCINCHAYNQGDPRNFTLHVRGDYGATILRTETSNGTELITAYNTKTENSVGSCVYPYWHPSGKYIAYSSNNTRQGFHMGGEKVIEVIDLNSDLEIYDIAKNELLLDHILCQDSIWETFPAFSPDGKTLYFCAAEAKELPLMIKEIRYNLYKVDFDPETGNVGNKIDTLVNAVDMGKSVSFPKPSFDGRFLAYTLSDYGNFSVWHKESDLYLMDLATGESKPMTEANSNDADSYHNWSSNSRWLVLGSRRDDGMFTRPYFCHIDQDGNIGKAFMMPRKDPKTYYEGLFFSYNIPEFVTGPVKLDKVATEKAILSKDRKQMLQHLVKE